METICAIIGFSLFIGLLVLKYLNGGFTYKDEIYSEKEYKKTNYRSLDDKEMDTYYVKRIVIKRTYESGKIKFIDREVRI